MPSLTVIPEQIRELRNYRTLRPPVADSAMMHRRSAYTANAPKVRGFVLLWQTATLSERDSLSTLYDDTHGGAISFDWSPPGEASQVAFFVEDSFSWDAVSGNQFSMSVTVELNR